MIIIRKYISTISIAFLGIILDFDLKLLFIITLISGILDFFITKKSPEMAMYKGPEAWETRAPQQLSRSQIISLQGAAALASAALPLLASAAGSGLVVHWATIMGGLLISGLIGSYCGFQLVYTQMSPREMLARLDPMPDVLGLLELTKPSVLRALGAFMRLGFGVICLLPFAASLDNLSSTTITIDVVIITFTLALLFQLGFILISQALFSLRWLKTNSEK